MNDDRCTYPACRAKVRAGEGTQFVRDDGTVDRYCLHHAREEWVRLAVEAHAHVCAKNDEEAQHEHA